MSIQALHSWNLTPAAAADLQRQLASQVDARTPLARWDLVAGADVSYNRFSPTIHAGIVVIRAADGEVVEKQGIVHETSFPYIPGFLSFREAPAVLEAFGKLKHKPDVLMLDGQGFAHPRRFGLACHVGLWLGLPTLGCAKSRLIGTFREPAKKEGSLAALKDKGEVIGNVVRTRTGVKPLYISVGHQIDLPSAVRVVLGTCRGYRIPEPTRQAHMHVNELRRQSV